MCTSIMYFICYLIAFLLFLNNFELITSQKVLGLGYNANKIFGENHRNIPYNLERGSALEGKTIVKAFAYSDSSISYIFYLDSNGNLYESGGESSRTEPKLVLDSNRIGSFKQICSYLITPMILDTSGNLYIIYNQNSSYIVYPIALKEFGIDDEKIEYISNGYFFSLIVSSTGKAYAVGRNIYGQLGIGESDNMKSEIVKVYSDGDIKEKKIIKSANGYDHSIILDSEGEVYTFGRNNLGQLGTDYLNDLNTPTSIRSFGVFKDVNNLKIVEVTCGYDHTVFLDSNGRVYGMGNNQYGQLGDTTVILKNVPVDFLINGMLYENKIIQVGAGEYHTLLLDSTGRVFGFGINQYGQISDGTYNSPISSLNCVTSISAGKQFSLFISKSSCDYKSGYYFSSTNNNIGDIENQNQRYYFTDLTMPIVIIIAVNILINLIFFTILILFIIAIVIVFMVFNLFKSKKTNKLHSELSNGAELELYDIKEVQELEYPIRRKQTPEVTEQNFVSISTS